MNGVHTSKFVSAAIATVGLSIVGLTTIANAQALLGTYWTYKTSETGSTRFNTLAEAEAAMRAVGPAWSYLEYFGEDDNDSIDIRRQYRAEPQTELPDDSEQWSYGACDWDLLHHECGPDGGGPFPDKESAFNWLYQQGYYSCGIAVGESPTAEWTQGTGQSAPTSVPAGPYQERQLRPYQFVTRRNPPPSEPPDCSAFETRTAILYRHRTLECPKGAKGGLPPLDQSAYVKVGPDANGQFHCENNRTAEIVKNNDAYDHSVKQCAGNPCNPTTGAKIETIVDYVAPGIEFSRTFRSKMVPWANTAVGTRRLPQNWTHSYVRVLRMDINSSEPNELFRPDGTSVPVKAFSGQPNVYFALDGSGTQVRPGAVADEWDVYFNDGSYEHYDWVTCSDASGDRSRPRFSYVENATGDRTSVNYPDSCADHPNEITGPFGHNVTITYAPFDPDLPTYIEKITDAAGRDIVFGYSAGTSGDLVSVTYQDGKVVQYHYEDTQPGNEALLTGLTDEEGRRFSTFAYDFAGRTIMTEHAGGDYRYTFDYDSGHSSTNVTVVTDARGNQTTYRIYTGGPARPWSITYPHGYDKHYYEGSNFQFRIRQTRNAANIKISYTYDDFHNTALIEDDGGNSERMTTFQYLNDTSDLKTRSVRPSVCNDGTQRYAEEETIYLAGTQTVSQLISRGYRLNGGICEAIDRTITLSNHNAAGQPRLIDGPRTDVTDTLTIDYYECTTGGACGQIQSITNAAGHVTTFDSYDNDGRVLQSTNANGLVTNYAYDLRGRLISITETPTVGSQRITAFTYEARDLVKTATLPTGLILTYDYNAAHRLLSVTDQFGNHIDYGYDAHGNRTDEDVFDTSNTLKRAVDNTFDNRNRLDTINSGGSVTDLQYHATGTPYIVTDAGSATTTYLYDRLDRVSRTIAADNGNTYFDYDVAGNLNYVKSPINDITTYVYDDLGNQLSETSPDRGVLTYTYDAAGNMASSTDSRGKVTTYAYDALDRPILTTFDGGQTITYNYDTGANGKGRMSSVTDSSGTTSWFYEQFGAITQKQQAIGAVTLTTHYAYDAAGQVSSMTLPSGIVVSYGHNGHLLTSITVDSQLLLSGVTYDPFGPVTGWTWGDLTVSSRTFDVRGLMTTHSLAADTRTLGYDPVGYVTAVDDARQDLSIGYDALGRLTDFTSTAIPGGAILPGSQVFTYDRNGNRLSRTEDTVYTPYTIESTSNRLLSNAGPVPKTYSYDAAGNITGDGTHTYGYDDRGRLVDVDSGAVTYQHNALGQRVLKNDGATTLFAYDESGQLIGEYDATGTPIREHVFFNGAPVAALQGANIYQVHSDHLGTPRAVTDTGTVIWRWESDPFGSTSADEDPDGNGTDFTYNLRFPGQYYDQETGLHYNYFRTLDPSTGRYLESDLIGLGGGLNTYGYVSGNPLSFIDPFGLETVVIVVDDSGLLDDHAALAIVRDGVTLYDPGGGYSAESIDSGGRKVRPRGDIFSKDVFQIDLDDFRRFHTDGYPNARVRTYVFPTTAEEEREILRQAAENGSTSPLFCGAAVSSAIDKVGPLSSIDGAFRPSVLGKQAERALRLLHQPQTE